MEPKKQTKAEKLLELLKAAGPDGILNSDLAANPAVGWAFLTRLAELRRHGHIIETKRVGTIGKVYRTILLKAAPAPELPPIFALLLGKEGGND